MGLLNKNDPVTFVILGHSPKVEDVHEKFLKNKTVIAVNQVPKIKKLVKYIDHWIVWDDHPNTFLETEEVFKAIENDITNYGRIAIWLRLSERSYERSLGWSKYLQGLINWYEDAGQHTDYKKDLRGEQGNLKLKLYANVSEVAIHLAWNLGAKEVILVGVDFLTDRRADGTKFYGGDPNTIKTINKSYKKLSRHVKIFKTMGRSPLQVPLFNKEKVYDK